MFDLKGILKGIGAEEKKERKEALVGIVEENIRWTPEDRTKVVAVLPLTKYELYWLMWRVRVHLKSYEHFEWSEMKDILTVILKNLEEEWSKCQSTAAPSVSESSVSGTHTTVDSVLTTSGS